MSRARTEQAVLSLLLRDAGVRDRADLEERHFADLNARALWAAARTLRDAGRDVTGYTLAHVAGTTEAQREAYTDYLRDVRLSLSQPEDLPELVDDLRREADIDEVIRVLDVASRKAGRRDIAPDELVGQLLAQLQGTVRRSRRAVTPIADLVRAEAEAVVRAVQATERGEPTRARVSSGLIALDREIGGGWSRGAWTVVGARPGGSKTAFLMQAARRAPCPVLVFAFEEVRDLAYRELASATAIPAVNIAGHRFRSGAQLARVMDAPASMRDDVYLVDARGMDAHAIARETRAQVADRGIGLVVIDYLNRMRHPRADRHDLSIRRTMEILDDVIGELDIAGLLGAQLSRTVAKEQRMPRMDDLRDSGAVEEICKLGIVLHRPYVDRAPAEGGDDEIWVVIDKQNLGKRRVVIKCDWDGPSLTLSDRAPEVEPSHQERIEYAS